jgi:23S rRNA (pseudouridine1915-N3)-methyltransferase
MYVVSDGYQHFKSPIDEYIKRLASEITIVTVAPSRARTPEAIVDEESRALLRLLAKDNTSCWYLDVAARQYTSADFASFIQGERNARSEPSFLIGGAYGVSRQILGDRVKGAIGLSEGTLPHSLALLVLLEQVYR